MKRELALEFTRTTEAAAIAAYKWLGRGDKNLADGAAVTAMRNILNQIDINGEIVIGEGEMDEAPMLYIGERVGTGRGEAIDIAVDPIEGTRMTALGQSNSLAVIVGAAQGKLFKAPDMYMEKICVGPKAKGVIDLSKSLTVNIKRVAKILNKKIEDITVITLLRDRHSKQMEELKELGVKVYAIPDGDIVASILTCIPFSGVDLMYTTGGAPEGVVSASIIRALDGDLQGRLLTRDTLFEATPENVEIGKIELERCVQMGAEVGRVYKLEELVRTDDIIFSATGITKGDLVEGIKVENNILTTETLLVRGRTGTIRTIKTMHNIEKKNIK